LPGQALVAHLGDLDRDQVDAAEELGDEAVGCSHTSSGGAPPAAGGHDRRWRCAMTATAPRSVVRHEDEGAADALVQRAVLVLHLLAQVIVERRKRLVEQQHARARDQRAGQGDALLLPPESCVGRRSRSGPSPTVSSIPATGPVPLHAGLLRHPQRKGDVLGHRHVRK
jgi:hypothetical protein